MVERMEVQVQKALFVQQLPPGLRVPFAIHVTGQCFDLKCLFGRPHRKESTMTEPETKEATRELDNSEDPISGIEGTVKRPGSGAGDLEKSLEDDDFIRKADDA